MQVWVDFRKNGVLLRLNDVVRSWLRLLTPIDCTYWMNTKYFSSLRCCGLWMGIWVHPYTVTPIWVGVDFRKIGAWLCFSTFGKMWMGIWVHPYCRITCTGGGMAEPVRTSILDVYKVF